MSRATPQLLTDLVWSRAAGGDEFFYRAGGDWVFAVTPFPAAASANVEPGDEVVGNVFAVADETGCRGFIVEVKRGDGGSLGVAPPSITGEIVRTLKGQVEGVLAGCVLKGGEMPTVRLTLYLSAPTWVAGGEDADEWAVFDDTACVFSVLDVDVNALGGPAN